MGYVFTGLGATAQQTVQQIGGASSGVVAAAAGPALGTALGISASLAIPIVGAALAGVVAGIEAILNSGCGETCIETSQWANQASAQLDRMMAAYFGVPAPRPQSLQSACLQIFQQIWNTLVQQCSQPNLGTAGQNCISDRQDGACKWKAAPPAYPGEPATGTCWNWWNAYYYPILNDPNVVPDSVLSSSASSSSTNSNTTAITTTAAAPGSIPGWVWLAAAAVALWAVR